MRIRVGLVLLTVTYVKEEVCTPTRAINTKNMALSHAINQWLKDFLTRGGKNRQFSWSGMISFFAFMFRKSSIGIKRWKGHIFTTCESQEREDPPQQGAAGKQRSERKQGTCPYILCFASRGLEEILLALMLELFTVFRLDSILLTAMAENTICLFLSYLISLWVEGFLVFLEEKVVIVLIWWKILNYHI